MVSGTVRFASADVGIDVPAGGFFSAPIGTPHGFGNATDEPALMLCTLSPQRYVEYLRELQQATKDAGRLDPEVLAEVMARYATELYRP